MKGDRARIEALQKEIARVEAERDDADTKLAQLRIAVQRYAAAGRVAVLRDDGAFRAMVELAKGKRDA